MPITAASAIAGWVRSRPSSSAGGDLVALVLDPLLDRSTAGGSPSDRPVRSGGSTALLWRPDAGRIAATATGAPPSPSRPTTLAITSAMPQARATPRRLRHDPHPLRGVHDRRLGVGAADIEPDHRNR